MPVHTIRLIDHPPHRPPDLGKQLRSAWTKLGVMTGQWLSSSTEPVITKGCDRHGNPYWELYDPTTKQTVYCMTEAEVFLWLDHSAHRSA